MPLIAKYRLTWRGSVVEPGTVIDALNPDEARRLFELQRTRSVVFVPEEEGRFTDQPSDYIIRIPRGDGHFERVAALTPRPMASSSAASRSSRCIREA